MTRPTLILGSTGAAVQALQQALTRAGFPLAVDGNFGPLTAQAVKGLQRAANLEADGVVGTATWVALENRLGVSLDVPAATSSPRTQPGAQLATAQSSGTGRTVVKAGVGLLALGLAGGAAWWKWGRR